MSPNYAFDSFLLLEGFSEATWLLEKHHLHVGSQRGGIVTPQFTIFLFNYFWLSLESFI